jgi:hypothetical protein
VPYRIAHGPNLSWIFLLRTVQLVIVAFVQFRERTSLGSPGSFVTGLESYACMCATYTRCNIQSAQMRRD